MQFICSTSYLCMILSTETPKIKTLLVRDAIPNLTARVCILGYGLGPVTLANSSLKACAVCSSQIFLLGYHTRLRLSIRTSIFSATDYFKYPRIGADVDLRDFGFRLPSHRATSSLICEFMPRLIWKRCNVHCAVFFRCLHVRSLSRSGRTW